MNSSVASKNLSLVILLCLSSCSLGRNILPNGSFEIVEEPGGDPLGWHATRIELTADFVRFGVSESGLASQGQSVFIEIDSAHPRKVELEPEYAANQIAYNWTRRVSEVKPGAFYVLSGWVKTQNLKGPAWIMVQCLGNVENFQIIGGGGTQAGFPISGTSDWTRVATVFSAPEGTQAIQLRAGISSPQNIGGKVWFDKLEIRELR